MMKMVNRNHPHPPPQSKSFTAGTSLHPFTVKDLKTERLPQNDPNFATCMVALETLRSSDFWGTANLELGKSALKKSLPKVTLGHFNYVAARFQQLDEPWPWWFEDLVLTHEDEIVGLDINSLRQFAAEVHSLVGKEANDDT